ncbi:MAG: hypothetical protein R2826_01950 [Thermoleophilia bacterium]
MRDVGWNGISMAQLASGYLREDVLEAAQTSSWLDEPKRRQSPGRIYRYLLTR